MLLNIVRCNFLSSFTEVLKTQSEKDFKGNVYGIYKGVFTRIVYKLNLHLSQPSAYKNGYL